jgi:hypothetical protein
MNIGMRLLSTAGLSMALLAAARAASPVIVARVTVQGAGSHDVVVVARNGEVQEGAPSCANAAGGVELAASCDLVLRSGGRELARVALGDCGFVRSAAGAWSVLGREPLRILRRTGGAPLVVFAQYGSCNGNAYSLFSVVTGPSPGLARASFASSAGQPPGDSLFAGSRADALRLLRGRDGRADRLVVTGYDNADAGNFIGVYEERAPGRWVRVESYSDADGTFERGVRTVK